MKPPVLTKRDFVKRYNQGEFGNRSPTWDSIKEFLEDFEGIWTDALFHVRNRSPGGKTYYNQTLKDIATKTYVGDYYVSEMAPTESTILQGEVCRNTDGLHLRYSRVKKPMRDALAEAQHHVSRITSIFLLQEVMNQKSFDWLMYLLDEYQDHTVEFSVYDKCWGTIPGYNTVYWEVRKY